MQNLQIEIYTIHLRKTFLKLSISRAVKTCGKMLINSRSVMCQIALPSYVNGATWVETMETIRRNRHFYPYFCHSVDTIDAIERIEWIEDNSFILYTSRFGKKDLITIRWIVISPGASCSFLRNQGWQNATVWKNDGGFLGDKRVILGWLQCHTLCSSSLATLACNSSQ